MFTLLLHFLLQFYLRAYLTPCTKPFEIPSRKCHTLQREHSPSRTENYICTSTQMQKHAGGGGPAAWGRLWVRFSPSSRWGISAAPGVQGCSSLPKSLLSPSVAGEPPRQPSQGWQGAMDRARFLPSVGTHGGRGARSAGGLGDPGVTAAERSPPSSPRCRTGHEAGRCREPKGEEARAGL